MVDLIENRGRDYHGKRGPHVRHPVDADTELFEGAALMHSAANGSLRNCTPTASGKFAGIAVDYADNRVGSVHGGAVGDAEITVDADCMVWLDVTKAGGWARGDNDNVYASDGNTFTTSSGTNNILIGKVVMVAEESIGVTTATRVLVHAQATTRRSI
jgi:hypothetical protein